MEEVKNKYCLKLRSNYMRYADQVVGNGNHHTYAEGCFENNEKWKIEAHTSRFWLLVDNRLIRKATVTEDLLDIPRIRTSRNVFYKFANELLDWYSEENNTKVKLPKDCI